MVDILLSCTLQSSEGGSATAALAGLVAGLDSDALDLTPARLVAGRKRVPVETRDAVATALAELPEGGFSLAPEKDKSAFFDGVAGAARASINLGFAAKSPLPHADAVSKICAALTALATDGKARFGGYSGLSVRNLEFVRQRPPRDYLVAGQTNLVDVVDLKTAEQGDSATAARIFSEAELPPKVKRTVVKDIAIVDWSAGAQLEDTEALAERLVVRDLWLAGQKVGRAAEGWSENGDAIADPLDAKPEEGLTLYSAALGIGYLAIHSETPPAERKAQLAAAAKIRDDGKTATGAAIEELFLVADTRAAALDLRPEAAKAGLKKIVYATDDHFLDPFPEGKWAEPETGK